MQKIPQTLLTRGYLLFLPLGWFPPPHKVRQEII
jgi:hypothetical protein